MSRPDASPPAPRFRLWLRRQVVADGPYSVRFEVTDGKGILRVSRPGVLIDPPARPAALEERLTAAQLRASRFLLVWDGGRARQAHLLTRLQEASLAKLEPEKWHEVEVLVEGGFRHLVMPMLHNTRDADTEPTVAMSTRALAEAHAASTATVSFPFSPASLTHSAVHGGLPAAVPATMPPPVEYGIDGTTVLTADDLLPLADAEGDFDERTLFDGVPEEETEEDGPHRRRPMLAPEHDEFDAFGVDEDAAFAVDTPGHRLETQHVMRGVVEAVTFMPGAAHTDEEIMEAGEAEDELHELPAGDDSSDELIPGEDATDAILAANGVVVELAVSGPGVDAADAGIDTQEDEATVDDGDDLHDRQTTLVRHLRRQVADQKTRIQALEARIRELESLLAPAAAAEA